MAIRLRQESSSFDEPATAQVVVGSSFDSAVRSSVNRTLRAPECSLGYAAG